MKSVWFVCDVKSLLHLTAASPVHRHTGSAVDTPCVMWEGVQSSAVTTVTALTVLNEGSSSRSSTRGLKWGELQVLALPARAVRAESSKAQRLRSKQWNGTGHPASDQTEDCWAHFGVSLPYAHCNECFRTVPCRWNNGTLGAFHVSHNEFWKRKLINDLLYVLLVLIVVVICNFGL